MKREEYVIVESIAAAARCASTMFEFKGEENEYHPDDMKLIGQAALKKTTKAQMENLWTVLEMTLNPKD